MRDKNKQSSQSGVVNILALLGVLVVMAMIPVTTKLVERSQEARTYAALEDGCQDRCHWQGGGENWDCGGDWKSCCCKLASNKSICGGCGGGGGGGGDGPGDDDGGECERDQEGACNRACCACGTETDNKICDVPNGYCVSGCSSRNKTSDKRVTQCVDTDKEPKCYWQICGKNDPNCATSCSSHADCRDGGPTPTPDPKGKPTPTPDPKGKPTPTPDPKGKPTPTPDPKGKPTPTPTLVPELTSTPTPSPVGACANEDDGSYVKVGATCYRCWWGNLQKSVDFDYCEPPRPPKEAPTPASDWSNDYCVHGKICTPGLPRQCEECPSGEKCAGIIGFAQCVEDNSRLDGTVTGSKIANGTITLVDASGKTYLSPTDQEGNFSLDAPTNQDYTVKISAPGYKLLTFNWNPIDGLDYFTKIKLERTGAEKEGNFEIEEDAREVLLVGWNLISLSTNLTEPLLASGLLEEINRQGGLAIAISRWQDSRWETFLRGVDKNDFPIELGRAYFVENLQETRFELEGEEITQSLPLELKPGWNAVGLPKMTNCPEETCSARSLLNLVDEAKSNSARAFTHFESGLWETVAKENEDFFGYDFSVRSGRGYLLKVSQPLKFSP